MAIIDLESFLKGVEIMNRTTTEIKARIKVLEEMKNDYPDNSSVQNIISGELRALYWVLMYEVDK